MDRLPKKAKGEQGLEVTRRSFLLGASATATTAALGLESAGAIEITPDTKAERALRKLSEGTLLPAPEPETALQIIYRTDGSYNLESHEGKEGTREVATDLEQSVFARIGKTESAKDIQMIIDCHNHLVHDAVDVFPLLKDIPMTNFKHLVTGPSVTDFFGSITNFFSDALRGSIVDNNKIIGAVVDAGGIWLHRIAHVIDLPKSELTALLEANQRVHNRIKMRIDAMSLSELYEAAFEGGNVDHAVENIIANDHYRYIMRRHRGTLEQREHTLILHKWYQPKEKRPHLEDKEFRRQIAQTYVHKRVYSMIPQHYSDRMSKDIIDFFSELAFSEQDIKQLSLDMQLLRNFRRRDEGEYIKARNNLINASAAHQVSVKKPTQNIIDAALYNVGAAMEFISADSFAVVPEHALHMSKQGQVGKQFEEEHCIL